MVTPGDSASPLEVLELLLDQEQVGLQLVPLKQNVPHLLLGEAGLVCPQRLWLPHRHLPGARLMDGGRTTAVRSPCWGRRTVTRIQCPATVYQTRVRHTGMALTVLCWSIGDWSMWTAGLNVNSEDRNEAISNLLRDLAITTLFEALVYCHCHLLFKCHGHLYKKA